MDSSNVALDGRTRQEPRKSSDTPISTLGPENRRLFPSASLHILVKKACRGAHIERREVAGLLSYTEADSDAGPAA